MWQTSSKLKKLPQYLGLDFTRGFYAYLYSQENRQWRTCTKKSVSTPLLHKHLKGEITIALPQYPHSKYLIFDIDTRSQFNSISIESVFNQIVKDFGTPAYYEISSTSGGYHIYYHMNEFITDTAKKEIEFRYMSKYRMVVEVVRKNKKIRLPYSAQYQDNAFDRFGMQITNFEHLYNTFENMYTNPFYSTKLPSWVHKINKHGVNIAKKREIESQLNTDRTYGYGTRHIEQIKIGFDTLHQKGSFQDFVYNCEYWNNGTSKDMALPENQKQNILLKIWEWCTMNFTPTPEYHYGVNGVMLNEYGQEEIINSIEWTLNDSQRSKLERAFSFYYSHLGIGKTGGVKEKEFIDSTLFLVEEIMSKKVYDKIKNSRYETKNDEINSKLSQGTLFNYELKKSFASKFNIKNYKKVWNFLEQIGFINPIKINGYSFSYKSIRYAKHYTIMNIDTFFNQYIQTKLTINNREEKKEKNGIKKNINYGAKFFNELSDGVLEERLEKVRLYRLEYEIPYRGG